MSDKMPINIWAYETNCKNSKGFGHWYDEDVSGQGADLDELIKAAKAYAELPVKVMGMKLEGVVDTDREGYFHDGYNQAIDELLTLLENQND